MRAGASKKCPHCGRVQPLEDFHANSRMKAGRASWCKECTRAKNQTPERKKALLDWYTGHRPERLEYLMEYYRRNRAKALVVGAKKRAKRHGWDFDLDDHLKEIQEKLEAGVCELTGIPFSLTDSRAYNSPSLDRIDSHGGYLFKNVRVVCWLVNAACWTWGSDRLREVMSKWFIHEYRKEKEKSMQFISYLLEQERAYCGASNLMAMLAKVGVDPSPYMLPLPYILSPDEVCIYSDSMLNDLRDLRLTSPSEEVEYVKTVCKNLREWGEKGYIVHVIS